MSDEILIIGGYGKVGRLIAEELAPSHPGQVLLAGRNKARAMSVAQEIGHGVRTVYMDAHATNIHEIGNPALVISCIDQNDTKFAAMCLSHGADYIDVTADQSFLQQMEELSPIAERHGKTALLSAGLCPGLSNLLATEMAEFDTDLTHIDIFIQLGLGDAHGKSAIKWMLEKLSAPIKVQTNGKNVTSHSFARRTVFHPAKEASPRSAYNFAFPDQQILARTLKNISITTWILFDREIYTRLFAILSKPLSLRLFQHVWVQNCLIKIIQNLPFGSDQFCLTVIGSGKSSKLVSCIKGREEARVTAAVCSEMARQMLARHFPAGVFHSHQLMTIDSIKDGIMENMRDLKIERLRQYSEK